MEIDPLAEIVTLLQPSARLSKLVECFGTWRLHRESSGEPFYCAILDGQCRVAIDGQPSTLVRAGDFILVPALRDLVNESLEPPPAGKLSQPVEIAEGHVRIGRAEQPIEARMRIGHCRFGSPDAALLISLLPQVVIVRNEPRLVTLMQLVGDETRATRPARELVLERLLEVLLLEALRCGTSASSAPGLARGLADERVAAALRAIHAKPAYPWTVPQLAAEATLSRSAFFARFTRLLGLAPMEYLLAWRMALAKRLLREAKLGMDEIAAQVGYGSASAFSVAFARHAGAPPGRYTRMTSVH